jgi:hypothetical protein
MTLATLPMASFAYRLLSKMASGVLHIMSCAVLFYVCFSPSGFFTPLGVS